MVKHAHKIKKNKKTLPSTSEKMVEEEDNRHATKETKKLIEK